MNGILLTAALAAQSPATQQAELAPVESRALEKTVSVPSDLVAFQSVAMYAKVAGFIETIDVDRGSWVKKDQMLAVILAPELSARTAEAEARFGAAASEAASAEARKLTAKSAFERLKAASATPGVVAGHDVEIAQRNMEAAEAAAEAATSGMRAAKAALEAVKEMEAYLEVRAPFDGVITERNVHRGSLVGPTGPLVVRIEQVSRLRLVVPVPEMYVPSITRGARVVFQVAAYPDRKFEGVVSRSAHSLEVKTRSMMVELDVENREGTLAPGMFAHVQWPVSRQGQSLFVPATAVVRTSERQFVVRVRDGVADWVDVRRGESQGELIEIFGELRGGEMVVRRGNDEIRPGTKIAAKTAAK